MAYIHPNRRIMNTNVNQTPAPVVTTPVKPSKPFPWGSVYSEVKALSNSLGCDVKWAIGGLFRGWIVLTAVGTFSAAIVLANPQNFQFLLKVLGLPETKQLLEKVCADGGTVVDSTHRGGYRYTILPGGNKCSYPPSGQ